MKTQLSDDACEMEHVVDSALRRAGGVDLARAAEAATAVPAEVTGVLDQMGLWDLRPHESVDDGEAAAAACRAAGRVALPYPVAERLAADPDAGVDAVAVATGPARVNLVALTPDLRWAVSDAAGWRRPVLSAGRPLGTKLGALVSDVELGGPEADGSAQLALVLPCWTLLGMLETALAATRRHMLDRRQFDQPIASFQALQFRFADTTTAFQAFEELTRYTLWAVLTGQPGAAVDALACRVSALETAEAVFRTAHQMHGAMGFCDEVDLSWLSRFSQPLRRLPWGLSRTRERLLNTMADVPFTGLYGDGLVGSVSRTLA